MNSITKYSFLINLTKLPFIEEIWLCGSRGRGDNHERADIDIAILCPNANEDDWHQVLDIIDDEQMWLEMLKDRNVTSHVYKYEDAKQVFQNIKLYLQILEKTYNKLDKKYFG